VQLLLVKYAADDSRLSTHTTPTLLYPKPKQLNECVNGLMSAGALANGFATIKPYRRQQQTILL